ncbi:MAG: hypothetical protein QGG48_10520, partial [Desulfatiglandales bacterium]|nr:hypothetical protein [Desulfatiglandales bacterium]
GDTRQLKEATTAWRDWDNQMRKNHGLSDTEAADKPLVNINVMAALPRMDDMKPRQEEQEAVEAEAA